MLSSYELIAVDGVAKKLPFNESNTFSLAIYT